MEFSKSNETNLVFEEILLWVEDFFDQLNHCHLVLSISVEFSSARKAFLYWSHVSPFNHNGVSSVFSETLYHKCIWPILIVVATMQYEQHIKIQ